MLTTKVQKHQGFLRKKEVSMKKVLSIVLVMAMLLYGVGFFLMKRPAVCPWCGERALFLGDYSRMTCHSCNNDCVLPR